ncbi:hypothetical protein J31TS4_12830 [Paenibacillus sp. J31TS4]|uniref:helix-turn-helix domain-containing protein n=1 Tax=Paenibacillus sp. J31TS4 TaxID=2807195 RepID=UPI001B01C457|nr:helix-turn-helix domain-containing protein [Paenibacillus sp. J31TS4]GIP38003.1 hypothetical protein J31TS4_12830 [Paenibacillus sp. J31TS4]
MGPPVEERKHVSVFQKQFLIVFATILIPTLFLLCLQLSRTAQDARSRLEASGQDSLTHIAGNFDLLLNQLNQISLQISLQAGISDMLRNPFEQSPYEISQNKELLRSWLKTNPLYYSMYLNIWQNGKVLTTGEGIYESDQFFDRAVLDNLISASSGPVSAKPVMRTLPDPPGVDVITLGRPVPVTQQDALGFLVINFRKDLFLQTLQNVSPDPSSRLLVYDALNQPVTEALQGFDEASAIRLIHSGPNASSIVKVGGERFLLTGRSLPASGWTIGQLIPYEKYYAERMQEGLVRAGWILAAVLLLGGAAAYFFASLLYHPWRQLALRLQSHLKQGSVQEKDAYTMVNSAIHHVLALLRKNEPIIRDHLVRDLLLEPLQDERERAERLREAGISFLYGHYAVLVIEEEPTGTRAAFSSQSLYLFSVAEKELQARFLTAGTILERCRFAFLLNLAAGQWDEERKAELAATIRMIRETVRVSMQTELSFYVSGIQPLSDAANAYEQVKRMMAYRSLLPYAEIYFAAGETESGSFPYPAAYQRLLLHAVLAEDRVLVQKHLNEFFVRYLEKPDYPYPQLQQMILMLMSHVLGSLGQEGYDIGPLMDKVQLLQLQHCHNRKDLQEQLLFQLNQIIAFLEETRTRHNAYSDIVQQAIRFMTSHYAEPLSISDIAASLNISHSHLSRVFKAEVGKSPLDYLTETRLNESKRLLMDKSLPLKEIGMQVGYQDVQTFIRSFKKLEGTTPGEFRKREMNHS